MSFSLKNLSLDDVKKLLAAVERLPRHKAEKLTQRIRAQYRDMLVSEQTPIPEPEPKVKKTRAKKVMEKPVSYGDDDG